jgi:anti-anti-sigma factor
MLLFDLPVADSDLARRGRIVLLLDLLLFVTTLIVVGLSAVVPILADLFWPALLAGLAIAGCVVALRRGLVSAAIVGTILTLLLLTAWVSATPTITTIPGIDGALALSYSLLMLLAAFLWMWWSAALLGVVIAASNLLLSSMIPSMRGIDGVAYVSVVVVGAILAVFARSWHDALLTAQAQTEAARAAQAETAAREAALQASNANLVASNERIQALYELVQDLEAPVIPLLDGALVVPVIGHLDHARLERLQTAVLQAVHSARAHSVIIDLTGLSEPDATMLERLVQLAHGVQLLGARVLLSGVSASTAQVFVQRRVTLPDVQLVGTLADGIQALLTTLGYSSQHTAQILRPSFS